MIGCLRTRVRKQPIIALYFESENVLKFYNLEARTKREKPCSSITQYLSGIYHVVPYKCTVHITFSNLDASYENSVDSDQLASDEAS